MEIFKSIVHYFPTHNIVIVKGSTPTEKCAKELVINLNVTEVLDINLISKTNGSPISVDAGAWDPKGIWGQRSAAHVARL